MLRSDECVALWNRLRPLLRASDGSLPVRHTRVLLCIASFSVSCYYSECCPYRNSLLLPRARPRPFHHFVAETYIVCNGKRDNRCSCIRPTSRFHGDTSVHPPSIRSRRVVIYSWSRRYKLLSSSVGVQSCQSNPRSSVSITHFVKTHSTIPSSDHSAALPCPSPSARQTPPIQSFRPPTSRRNRSRLQSTTQPSM
jgi:hypothetical protein